LSRHRGALTGWRFSAP
jgi:hypothetical protein